MKPNRPQPEKARHWQQLKHPTRAPRHLRRWLTDEGSLTRLLKRASRGRFSVRLVHQGFGRPGPAEAAALRLKARQQALIREVYLCGAGEPWVYARTVIPVSTLTGRHRTLKLIGTRSLGSLLFRDPGMRRQPLQIARLNTGLWARRSVFHLDRKPLLVCEVFLASLEHIQYPA